MKISAFYLMRIPLFFFFFLLGGILFAQVKISSWNLQNFGKTKTEAEINFMANTLKDFDVVAIQEVVAGKLSLIHI